MLYNFKNIKLKNSIFTHPSFKKNIEFQRLEFLGDKILSFYIAQILFENKMLSEGELSVSLSNLVNKKVLSKIGEFLIDDIKYNGTLQDSIIADTLEAWLCGIFLDGGDVELIIKKLWSKHLKDINIQQNAKNLLQEYAQDKGKSIDYVYNYKNNIFEATVTFNNMNVTALGNSKKDASEQAAKLMLLEIKKYKI